MICLPLNPIKPPAYDFSLLKRLGGYYVRKK